jgi:hypothetical protein
MVNLPEEISIVVVSDQSDQLIGVVFGVGEAHVVCQFKAEVFRVAPVALVPFRERLASTVVIIMEKRCIIHRSTCPK